MPTSLAPHLTNFATVSPFRSKLQAKEKFKGKLYYVASYIRHVSFTELTELYNKLKNVDSLPTEFLKIFKGIQTKESRIMAWYKLYNYIMDCEVDTNRNCDIIDTIYDWLPPKYNTNYSLNYTLNVRPNINKPATRKNPQTEISQLP